MNVKLLFVVMMILSTLPFIIAAFVMDQTKRSIAAFACLLASVVALWAFGQTSYGAPVWLWLHSFHHVLIVLAAGWFLMALIAIGGLWQRRRRSRRLEWIQQPSQQQFSRSCLGYLRRHGWTPQGRLSRTFIDIERMGRGSQKATFMFTAHPFQVEAVRRLLSQTVYRPHGQTIVISWHDEAPGMQTILEKMGWRCLSVHRLREEEEQDEED